MFTIDVDTKQMDTGVQVGSGKWGNPKIQGGAAVEFSLKNIMTGVITSCQINQSTQGQIAS